MPEMPPAGPARQRGDAGKSDRLTRRVLKVCDAVGDFIEAWGFKSIQGRVWSLLALHAAPMSQSEIAEILGVSRSLVHLTISELDGYGLVRQVGDHRNAPYEARLDVWPTISDILRSREWMLMEQARISLEAAIGEAEANPDLTAESGYDLQRIRLLLAMTEFAQACLRAILAIRVPRAFEELGTWLTKGAALVKRAQERLPAWIR